MRNDTRGVSKIIGVVILVVIVILLSVGVLFTAQTLIGDQPQDMTAGTTDERVDFYTHEAQLVNQGNTETVYAISPLGTEYELEDAGDLQKILPLAKDSHPSVDQYQIVGERDGQRQLLKTSHFEEGVQPDVVVHDDGDKDYESIQAAINNIDDDTERDISSEEPGVIVVQKGVYKENIEVSDNINLIAEYGTVIQDANPNEDVVDIRGDNVRFQNFEVDGNPDPEDEDHYARHGINVQGSDAVIQGNTIQRADSPDVTSAGIHVNNKNTLVRYNNIRSSQQSIHFGQNAQGPAVCGNQFENGVGGSVTTQTKKDVATLNHWNNGMPTNLAKAVIASETSRSENDDEFTLPGEAPREVLENTNSHVDPTILGDDAGRAALPFTGTKMGTSETPGECELSISLVNTDSQSINIEEIQVTINGQKTTIEVVQEVNLGDGESSDTRDGPTATCDCGGDGSYDPGDRISVSESSFGEIQTYTTEGEFEPLPLTDGGSEPTPSSFNVEPPGGTPISTSSTTDTSSGGTSDDGGSSSDSTQSNDEDTTNQEQDFTILLGSSVDINLADEVVLEPVISGAESPQDEIQYEWDLGDGSTSTDRVVRHVYDEPGTYTVELTVTDPATDETDTDSTTVTVEEGTKDVEKIRSDEQQRLADLVEEDPDGDGKVLYLEEGTTYDTLSTISAQDLTIIGQGDAVTLNGPITVTSSGVTMKNVVINGGLNVQNNDFKLYNSDISNSDGYAVELNANGGGFQIGNSKLTGSNGVYVGVDNDVLLSENNIDASGSYGVHTEEAVKNLRIRDNTIDSNDIGIYESLAVDGTYERNTINAPTELEQQEATAPEVNDISVQFTTTDVPLALSTQVNDPDGYPIDEVTWEVNGETFTRHPSNDLIYTFDEPGEYTISVTVTDQFGKTTTESKTVTVEEFEASLTTSEEASQNDAVTASVDYNIPENRVQSIEYDWGDGESDVSGSSSDTHTYSETGTYDISVTVNPDEGESRTVTNSISIVGSPVADFTIEDKLLAGEPIQFNGEYSTAPDGGSLDYTWNMGDGTTYTTESPQHTYADTGTYTVTLTVEGSDGYTDEVSAQLEFKGFTVDASGPSKIGTGNEAKFDVSTSIGDSNVDMYSLDLDPNDGVVDKTSETPQLTHSFTETGSKTVEVNAISDGYSVGEEVEVEVKEAPSFDITADTTSIEAGESISFSAENVDVTNPSYTWDFGDSSVSSSQNPTHTFDNAGSYSVSLTVEDSEGIQNTKSIPVTVDTTHLDSLVGYWDFESGSGSTVQGRVNNNNGDLRGDAQFTTDSAVGDHAVYLDGNNDYVHIPDDASLDSNDEITVSMWIKPNDYKTGSNPNPWSCDYPTWLVKGEGQNIEYQNYRMWGDCGETHTTWVVGYGSGSTKERASDRNTMNYQEWNHVVATYDYGNDLNIYVNGERVHTNSAPNRPVTNNGDLVMGKAVDYFSGDAHGKIDDVRVYNSAISESKVSDLYTKSHLTPNGHFTSNFDSEPTDSGAPDRWTKDSGLNDVEVRSNTAATGSQSVYISDDAHDYISPDISSNAKISEVSWQMYEANSVYIGMDLRYDGGSDIIALYNGDLQLYGPNGWEHLASGPNDGEWVKFTVNNIDAQDNTIDVHWNSPNGSGTVSNVQLGEFDSINDIKTHTFRGSGYFDNVRIEYEE